MQQLYSWLLLKHFYIYILYLLAQDIITIVVKRTPSLLYRTVNGRALVGEREGTILHVLKVRLECEVVPFNSICCTTLHHSNRCWRWETIQYIYWHILNMKDMVSKSGWQKFLILIKSRCMFRMALSKKSDFQFTFSSKLWTQEQMCLEKHHVYWACYHTPPTVHKHSFHQGLSL